MPFIVFQDFDVGSLVNFPQKISRSHLNSRLITYRNCYALSLGILAASLVNVNVLNTGIDESENSHHTFGGRPMPTDLVLDHHQLSMPRAKISSVCDE